MMNLSRALRLALSAALLSGSLPLPAAANVGRVAVVVPGASANVGAAGAARGPALLSGPSGLALSAPSLAPSALIPALNAHALAAGPLAAAPVAPALSAPSAAPFAAPAAGLKAASAAPAAALAAPASAPDHKTVIAGVETAVTELQGAKHNGPTASPAVLDRLFEGFARREATSDAPAVSGSASAAPARLAPASAKSAAADGPRWVLTGEQPAQPKSSWKRTFSVGYVAAVGSLVATMLIVGVAQALGHVLHPNYASPAEGLSDPSLIQAGVLFVAASIMAPIAEEIIFRAGIQGGLSKVTKFLRLGSFVIPAVLGSLIFVAVHETADPVLFGARLVGALLFAYVYQKEGMLASMAMHFFHNGLLTAPIFAAAIVGALGVGGAAAGLLSFGIMGAGLVAAVVYFIKSWKLLRSQREDIKSGALAPKAFTAAHGWWALVLMTLGFNFLMPNPIWLLGAVGIAPWLIYKRIKG